MVAMPCFRMTTRIVLALCVWFAATIAAAIAAMIALVLPVQAATVIVTSPLDNGAGTLRQAIIAAAPGDTIQFDPAVFGKPQTITLSSALAIHQDVAILGPGADMLVLNGNGAGRVFTINAGAVSISDLSIISGTAGSSTGGGIYANSALTLTRVNVIGNRAAGGGGVFATGAVVLSGGRFADNVATTGSGGGLAVSATLMMSGTAFISNTADQFGGGVIVYGAQVILNGGRFQGNRAVRYYGGGLQANSSTGTVAVNGTQFISNTATNGAGLLAHGVASISGATFAGNTATSGNGGGLYANTTVYLTSTLFEDNTAAHWGGGAVAYGAATLQDCIFRNNVVTSTAGYGGGLYANTALTVNGSTFISNTAAWGGGVIGWNTLTMVNTVLTANTAISGSGGGLYSNRQLSLVDSRFTGNRAVNGGGLGAYGIAGVSMGGLYEKNSASGDGGAVYSAAPFDMTGNTLVLNTATGGSGGGIYNQNVLSLINSTLVSNTAPAGKGGAVYNQGIMGAIFATLSGNSANNGGAIFSAITSQTTITNTIVANNSPGGDCAAAGSMSIDGSNNLESGDTCSFNTSKHALKNSNPLLGPLQLNPPGRALPTMALLPGSPAIDAANCFAGIADDERGLMRPAGFTFLCDIGAFEVQLAGYHIYLPVINR